MIKHMKKFCSHYGNWIYFFASWLLTAIEIDWIVGKFGMLGLVYTSPMAIAESLIWGGFFMLPFIFLPSRLRWIQLIILLILVIFNTANCFYFRNFVSFIPLTALTLSEGVNKFTIDAVTDSFLITDLIIWFAWLVQLFMFIILRKPIYKNRFGWKITASLTITVVISVAFLQKIRYKDFIESTHQFDDEIRNYKSFTALVDPFTDFMRNGYFEMYILYFFDLFEKIPPLDKHEIYEITKLTSPTQTTDYQQITSLHHFKASDDIKLPNKNLIFIIVESLNSSALGLIYDGKRFTPTLDSLKASPNVLTFDGMRSQALLGNSSDGQFIYNTGLYPLEYEITVTRNSTGPFPSLCRELMGYDCWEFMGENKQIWRHDKTSKAYGYNGIIDRLSDHEECNEDETILMSSLNYLKNLKRPFFALITTLSMHSPYDYPKNPIGWNLSNEAYSYLSKTHAFDQGLKSFLDGLKQEGLYDDTIIVMASDHQAPSHALREPAISDGRIILMIINSGLPGGIDSRTVGQIDVYPTILDVMGMKHPRWPGMGQSLIQHVPGFAVVRGTVVVGDSSDTSAISRQKRLWKLSARMIKTNTFPSLR